MASFNFLINSPRDKAGNLKKSEQTIYLWCTITRAERIALNTGYKVVPKDWNFNQKCFRASAKASPEKNASLNKLKAKVELAFMASRFLDFDRLKVVLQTEISPVLGRSKGVPLLSEAITIFMEDMNKVFAPAYLRGYEQVINFVTGRKNRLSEVDETIKQARDLPIDKIGSEYINKYIKMLIEEGYQNATIKKHIKFIKKVLNVNADIYKLDRTYTKPKNIKLSRKKPFWLGAEEARLLIGHQFESKRFQQVADEWLFRYYSGLRDQDSHQLQPHHVRVTNGVSYLDMNMLKNGRDFIIPLTEAALLILEKYGYKLPKYSNQEKNRIIKLCFKEVGLTTPVEVVKNIGNKRIVEVREKCQMVSTHTARRSFGRRFMDSNHDIEALSQLLGQASSEVTRHYIGWEPEEYATMVNSMKF